jgi:hypothetical protein
MLAERGLDHSEDIERVKKIVPRRNDLLADFFGFDVLPRPVSRNSMVESRR